MDQRGSLTQGSPPVVNTRLQTRHHAAGSAGCLLDDTPSLSELHASCNPCPSIMPSCYHGHCMTKQVYCLTVIQVVFIVSVLACLCKSKYTGSSALVPICRYCLNCTKFGPSILKKIIKIVATRCQILRLKCTKFDFGWGSAPDPAWGAYSAPPEPLAGFKGAYF